jgi:hypothetical protein
MPHACGPDCTSVDHEPIIEMEPVGWDGFGSALWPWQMED